MGERALVFTGISQFSIRCVEDGVMLNIIGDDFRQLMAHAQDMAPAAEPKAVLESLPCCKAVTRDTLSRLSQLMSVCTCDSLTSLARAFAEGEAERSIFILHAGTLTISLPRATQETQSSQEERTVTLQPGDVLGNLAIRVVAASLKRQLAESKRASTRKVSLLVGSGDNVIDFVPSTLRYEAERCFLRKMLKSMEPFQTLLPDELDAILEAGTPHNLDAGTVISSEGDVHDGFYLVFEGTARASRSNGRSTLTDGGHGGNDGAKQDDGQTIGYFSSGDHFGGVCIIEPSQPRKVTVTALTDLSCLVITREALGPFLERIKYYLARELSNRRWVLEYRDTMLYSDLAFGVTLGEGTFGRVKLVQHRPTRKTFALKCLTKMHLIANEQVDHVASERSILQACNHPFLLRMLGAFQSANELFLLLELIPGGELLELLNKKKAFGTVHTRFYAANVVSALAYLNSLSIVYRDIKPENMLLDGLGYVKIVDLGFAKVIEEKCFTFCGTPDYMPPEMIVCKPHGLSCDWWSVGILIYEMMIGSAPFTHDKQSAVFRNILKYCQDGKISFPFLFNWWAADLIRKLLTPDPSLRIGAAECLKHGFFSAIDFLELEQRRIPAPFVPNLLRSDDGSTPHELPFEEMDDDDEEEDSFSPRTMQMAKKVQFAGFSHVGEDDTDAAPEDENEYNGTEYNA